MAGFRRDGHNYTTSSAPDLLSGDQLRHVHKLSEMSESSEDIPPKETTSTGKSLPPYAYQ